MVLVTGTFNILHAGHIELLEFANNFGSVTVGINGQQYQVEKYGEYAVPLVNRAKVLRACRYVDQVVFFNEPDPSKLIRRLKPDFFVRGPDYINVSLPEQEALNDVGAELIVQNAEKIANSSDLSAVIPDFILKPIAHM